MTKIKTFCNRVLELCQQFRQYQQNEQSPEALEHKKTMRYGTGNPCLEQAQKRWWGLTG